MIVYRFGMHNHCSWPIN